MGEIFILICLRFTRFFLYGLYGLRRRGTAHSSTTRPIEFKERVIVAVARIVAPTLKNVVECFNSAYYYEMSKRLRFNGNEDFDLVLYHYTMAGWSIGARSANQSKGAA